MLYNKDSQVAVSLLTFKSIDCKERKVLPEYLKLLSWATDSRYMKLCLNSNINKAILDNDFEWFKRTYQEINPEADNEVCRIIFGNLEVQWVSKFRLFKARRDGDSYHEYLEFFKEKDWLTGYENRKISIQV